MDKPRIVQQDPLRQVANEVREFLRQEELIVYHGTDIAEPRNRIYWNQAQGGDWKSFLQCAQALAAKPIYLRFSEFDEFEMLDVEDEDIQRTFASRIGQVCIIELLFHYNGFMHCYQDVADWYEEFERLTNDLDDEELEDDDDDELNHRPF
jgi:hypothetical protein